ncbi:hypothetical protein ACI784_20775 [Geodermatophilus sp. SYSU D01186]
MTARTRVRHGILAGVGAAGLAVATVLVGPSAAAAPPDDGSALTAAEGTSGADSGDTDAADVDRLIPEDLQQDLQDLHDLPADERMAAMQDIVTGALSGEYGEDVENWTEDMRGVWSSLPADLQADLASAFGQEPEQVGGELSQVFENARDGEYGQSVQFWTDWAAGTVSSWDIGSTMDASSE